MTKSEDLLIPEVHNKDIEWIENKLGVCFDEPRRNVLKQNTTLDVCACPGSGKTTLLVAKLAVLAKKWSHQTRGLCVLSHTNAARDEIEAKLGGTDIGKNLLSYPHYFGTIHGFVNSYIAIPWMRSNDVSINTIDSDFAINFRYSKLSYGAKNWLSRRNDSLKSLLSMKDIQGSIGSINNLGSHTQTYKSMQNALYTSLQKGIFTFDELFFWANEALEKATTLKHSIHDRFPILFIDEAQDNNDTQTEIINKVFNDDEHEVVCQRFGDDNQAIYGYTGESIEGCNFPGSSICFEVSNSHRFNQNIADLSAPLAVRPHAGGFVGNDKLEPVFDRQKIEHNELDISKLNTIFLFNEGNIKDVIPSYAKYIADVFNDDVLNNPQSYFSCVGAIHKRPEEDDNCPRSVYNYWDKYNKGSLESSLQLSSFTEYFFYGKQSVKLSGENITFVNRVAEGIMIAANQKKLGITASLSSKHHNYLTKILCDKDELIRNYSALLSLDTKDLTSATWKSKWEDIVKDLALAVSDSGNICDSEEFWNFSDRTNSGVDSANNTFVYHISDSQMINIHVGSIHSVKGATHTATLILDTFNRTHYWKKLLPFLCKKEWNKTDLDGHDARRRLHYVAMTRPRYLLCIALPKETFYKYLNKPPTQKAAKEDYVKSRWNIVEV